MLSGDGMRRGLVLLLEDDADLRDALGDALAAAGYELVLADSGATALANVQDRKLDYAVVDLHLPGLRGIDVAAELRRRNPDVQVILMSGAGDTRGLPEGTSLLRKPFGVDRLLSALEGNA